MTVLRLGSLPASVARDPVGIVLPALDRVGIGAIGPHSTRQPRHRHRLIIVLTSALVLAACIVAYFVMRNYLESEAPYVPAISIYDALVDSTPVVVTFPS